MDKIGRLRALEKLDEAFEAEIRRVSTVQYNSNEICRHFFGQLRAKYENLIAELGQEVGAVADEWIDIPKAQALIAAVGPGYRVIYRDAFRWKDENGHVLPNHYEMFSAPGLCADFGHELILDLGNAAILRDKRTSPAHTSEARDAARYRALKTHFQAKFHRATCDYWVIVGELKTDPRFIGEDGEQLTLDNALDAAIAAMRQDGGTP